MNTRDESRVVRPRSRFLPLTASLLVIGVYSLLLMPTVGRAQVEKSPFPSFTGEPVVVVDAPDQYDASRQVIRELERKSPRRYYVVVVKSAGSGTQAAQNYADDLFERWEASSGSSAQVTRFDAEHAVLIVLAIQNRQVALKPSLSTFQSLGLNAATIQRDLIQPAFIPLARKNDYVAAVTSLVRATESWIGSRENRQENRTVPPPPQPRPARIDSNSTATTSVSPRLNQPALKGKTSSMFRRDAAIALIGSAIAIGLLIWGLIWLGRRRLRQRFGGKLKELRRQAVEVMDRLDALKERIKLLPASNPEFKQPMKGQTLERYEQIKTNIEKLWDRWLHIMGILDKAEKVAGSVSSLSNQKIRDAEDLLKKEGTFPEVEKEAQEAAEQIDQLGHAHADARSRLQDVRQGLGILQQRVQSIKAAGLPIEPYGPASNTMTSEVERADQILVPDPVGSLSGLTQVAETVRLETARADQILAQADAAKALASTIEETARIVAGHRGQGLKLAEHDGNPDGDLDEARARLSAAQQALRQGDPQAAVEAVQASTNHARQARETLDRVLKARDLCQREQPARLRETRRLREALPQAETSLEHLRRNFAPESWDAVARNVDQARALLATFDRQAEEAAAAASNSRQEYLLGARLIEQLAQQQQIALRLMAALGEQINILEAARRESLARGRDLDSLERDVESEFEHNGSILGRQAVASLESARAAADEVRSQLEASRPNWPLIRQNLAKTIEEFEIARTQAQADLRAYSEVRNQYDDVERAARRIEDFLRGHREDRPAANRRFQSAQEALERVRQDLTNPSGDWQRLTHSLSAASDDLKRAESLAAEDIRLAAQAESELAEATALIRRTSASLPFGILVDSSGAEDHLRQAERSLRSQNYEQAIQQANAAVQAARLAQSTAEQQAMYLQQQFDMTQRRNQAYEQAQTSGRGLSMGAAAAAGAAAAILYNVARDAAGSSWSSSEGSSSSNPEPPQPIYDSQTGAENPGTGETGTGSWTSETGQGSW
jgi:uncharacterized membrane protein YgcG